MIDRIHLSSPDISQHEEAALIRALRSGWVAPLGPEVDALEQEIADYTGRRYAVALSSGTAALHLALLNVGATRGTVVITSTMTFAATANAIAYTGATPVFVDADSSGNVDPHLLEQAVYDQIANGNTIAALLPVDLLGKVADYKAIDEISRRVGVPVISDAAESLGAVRDGRPAASFGLAAAISFNGNKIMTTSGGGMLVTDTLAMADRARYLATQARQPTLHYEHTDIGYNYRLSNLLAALGRAQLHRLPAMMDRRRKIRRAYADLFWRIPGVEIFGGDDGNPGTETWDNCWLTSIVVDPARSGWSAQDLQRHLAEDDIEARPLWKPMHLQPVFRSAPRYINGTSDSFFASGVSLPSGSALSGQAFDRIEQSITHFLKDRS